MKNYNSSDIFRKMKYKGIRWARHECKGENAYKILIMKSSREQTNWETHA
jgi:hypothetical protein